MHLWHRSAQKVFVDTAVVSRRHASVYHRKSYSVIHFRMPTTYPRTQITRGPRVQRILKIGETRFPGRSPGEILVELAAERAAEIERSQVGPDPLAGLVTIAAAGHVVTRQMVEDALDED